MLNIYFTGLTTGDGKLRPQYRKILSYLKQYHIISGEQITQTSRLKKEQETDPEQIFRRQKELIERADVVVAEVTKPSHGVGGEIVYALSRNIPVLALLQAEYEDTMSPMLMGNPSEHLFLTQYKPENLRYVLREFCTHIRKLKKRKGKLIVIDGGDGSGKTTQATLLVQYLKKQRIPTKYVDFPQYYSSFHGKTVARFLRGEFGGIDQVSPYLASLAYALDRASLKHEMEDFLQKGGYIVANRYATSNMAHQGAKFLSEKEREAYWRWVYELEYKIHKIPREDIVIYLYVPWQTARELASKRGGRSYLKGQAKDIHEKDDFHIRMAEKMYLQLCTRYRHWQKIDCTNEETIDTKDAIHSKIIQLLMQKQIIVHRG